jgi:plastocyanin
MHKLMLLMTLLSLWVAPEVSGVVFSQEKPAGVGTITGTVRYTGIVPETMKIVTQDGATVLLNDIVVDPKNKGLQNVIAVLEDAKPAAQASLKAAVMDQRDMVFVPRVLVAQAGQTVRFQNSDQCNHCVKADSIKEENSFNTVTPPSKNYEHAFKAQKSPVVISCPIHAWMKAYVFVVDHPWACATDATGKFLLEKVAPGKYTLLLIHPDTGHRERHTVNVAAGMTVNVQVEWKSLPK